MQLLGVSLLVSMPPADSQVGVEGLGCRGSSFLQY